MSVSQMKARLSDCNVRAFQNNTGNDLQAIADAMPHSVGHMPDYAYWPPRAELRPQSWPEAKMGGGMIAL
jgi:hypothetical protein